VKVICSDKGFKYVMKRRTNVEVAVAAERDDDDDAAERHR